MRPKNTAQARGKVTSAKAEALAPKWLAKEAERQSKAKKAVKDMSDAEIKAETIQKKAGCRPD